MIAAAASPAAGAGPGARYLCVELAGERYALPLASVQEVLAYAAPTPLPRMAAHLRGVTNLHGTIVPVVDLRARLGIAPAPYGARALIVFVAAGRQLAGLIVDGVAHVLELEPDRLQPASDLVGGGDARFVRGVARPDERLVVVIDTDALLRSDPALASSLSQAP